MRGSAPEYVESLAVTDGTILCAGALSEARRHVGPETQTVDLRGRTLLPGFIDTHGHFVSFGKNLVDTNLFGCTDVADLVPSILALGDAGVNRLSGTGQVVDRTSTFPPTKPSTP